MECSLVGFTLLPMDLNSIWLKSRLHLISKSNQSQKNILAMDQKSIGDVDVCIKEGLWGP